MTESHQDIRKRQSKYVYNCLPFRMCRGPKLQQLAYHVIHPQQQSQMFDSKQGLGIHLQPENTREII